jgi:hypothetical protein
MRNPFEPPRSNLQPPDRTPGSVPKAVAVGVFIDITGSLIMSFAAAILYSIVLSVQGYSTEQIQAAFENVRPFTPFHTLTTILGMLVSGFAGYHCARSANRPDYLAPGIVALISCTLGAAISAGAYSLRELFVLCALTVVAVLCGAALHVRTLR